MDKARATRRGRVIGSIFVAACAAATPASAELPRPVIAGAVQATPLIYDAAVVPDYNGRVVLDLVGTGLGPDGSHPANGGGYVHLFVRGVTAGMKAGKWIECGNDPCFMYGSTSPSVIHLGIRPDFYISEAGSHLQFKLFVTPGASMATDPSQDGTATGWSDIYTVDRALAGATAPVKESPAPTLVRLSPDRFTQSIGPGEPWVLTAFGDHICGEPPMLVVNGDTGNALPALGHCMGIDDSGAPLPKGVSQVKYALPYPYRQPGTYSVAFLSNGRTSGEMRYEVRGMTINRNVTSVRPEAVEVPITPEAVRPIEMPSVAQPVIPVPPPIVPPKPKLLRPVPLQPAPVSR